MEVISGLFIQVTEYNTEKGWKIVSIERQKVDRSIKPQYISHPATHPHVHESLVDYEQLFCKTVNIYMCKIVSVNFFVVLRS